MEVVVGNVLVVVGVKEVGVGTGGSFVRFSGLTESVEVGVCLVFRGSVHSSSESHDANTNLISSVVMFFNGVSGNNFHVSLCILS